MENQTPPAEELIKKIHELELGHAHLKQQMSKLMTSSNAEIAAGELYRKQQHRHVSNSFTDQHYLNILESMGQVIYIFDLDFRLFHWSKSCEDLFGYSSEEVLGKDVLDLLCDPRDRIAAAGIIRRVAMGETWTGQFPVVNKRGRRFIIVLTDSPFFDDHGSLVGVICVASDSTDFQSYSRGSSFSRNTKSIASEKFGLDPEQTLQTAIASKISDLASKVGNKVKSKMWSAENLSLREGGSADSHYSDREDAASNASSTPRGDIHPSPFGIFSTVGHDDISGDESKGKPRITGILSTKAEAWMGKKGLSWPWKVNERDGTALFVWPWLQNEQENKFGEKMALATLKLDNQVSEANRAANNKATGYWSSSVNINSSSSASSCESTSSGPVTRADIDSDSLDYEILWEELTIGEQIGQGSCGTVYHALWYGSDVAIKVFSREEYSEDLIFAFRQEVSLMKALRHPNILLFMGAVTSLQRLCIVTEFLPRGSLFRLLQRNKLDWKRRIQIALDIARGMNYLHRRNPPIVHRDLKSSNLLVDKNWIVKVGDFGLSRLKTQTYLTTKTGKGTPQWMAPEVLRNESSDEKSDLYSFGVVLWELVTHKIPWESLNSMQVIGAVGFMNQRLDIPKDIDPQWASMIESCWHDEPRSRPSFQELMETLKDLQKKYTLQSQAARAVLKSSQK